MTTFPFPVLSRCVISWHELPAMILIMTTLPCPLLRDCVILWYELPAITLIMTTLPCPLLSLCVISWHELPAMTLIITTFPCPLLSWCVISWHELPATMLNHDNFPMFFFHASKSLNPWLQLSPMVLMMALLYLTLSLCVILPCASCRDADNKFTVSSAVFRRCVTLSKEGAFISLIALLSVGFFSQNVCHSL